MNAIDFFKDIIESHLPWWFDWIRAIKTVIEDIITHWFTVRDVIFIIFGILVGIFIYRVLTGRCNSPVEKTLFTIGEILKLIYKIILNLTIKPLILLAVFTCLFMTLMLTGVLIVLSYRFFGFFIPTVTIIITVLVTVIIIKGINKKDLLRRYEKT
ncbi:MAG: hypothetical protein AB1414_02090 [bacterium]